MKPTYTSLRIADMLPDDRPRERLERFGPQNLTTPELLAILFRTGTKDRNAVQVAEDVFRQRGGLAGLATASLVELAEVHGVGRVKAIELKAAVELGKRLAAMTEEAHPEIRSPDDVAKLMSTELRYETKEHLYALVLDSRQRVRKKCLVSTGTLTESLVHPREVYLEAIRFSAASLVLVHNHPSGDPEPSEEDLSITKRLVECGELLGIQVLDHVIVAKRGVVSLRSRQLI